MFRSNSPSGYDTSSFTGSVQSTGYSTMDEMSAQGGDLSRPNAKSIYLQRKEYAEAINKMMDTFQYRVEHLFTCDLDGKELKNVGDCVERLKLLDTMGRVWGQVMLLEVRGANLLLTDVETKEELEVLALSGILELQAVLDAGVYNSLLTVSVQNQRKKTTSIFMFQCEDVGADYIKKELSRALLHKKEDSKLSNHGNLAGPGLIKNRRNAPPPPQPRPPPGDPAPRWNAPDYDEDDDLPTPVLVLPHKAAPPPRDRTPSPPPTPTTIEEEPLPPPRPYTERDRNVDILNHIFSDLEIFMGQIAAVLAKDEKKNKKKKKKGKVMDGMPSIVEFSTCLQKIKYGFNLLAELNGEINYPSAPEFVHHLFTTLEFVVSHCPKDLPRTIVAPLLTPECIRLLSEEATTEEDQLWQSLGDPWNVPSTRWPEDDDDIPTYTLEFSDGWQPPEVRDAPLETSEPVSSQENQRLAPNQRAQRVPPLARPGVSRSNCMRVMYDFIARNHRELSITKGEVVELLDKTKQWWKVRNSRREEGFVPSNVLEPLDKEPDEQIITSSELTRRSKPEEVKAWLESKGFSKITVRCLGPLNGSMLLGMTREELKEICPEEGGRVFYQLQAVKSALAVNNSALK